MGLSGLKEEHQRGAIHIKELCLPAYQRSWHSVRDKSGLDFRSTPENFRVKGRVNKMEKNEEGRVLRVNIGKQHTCVNGRNKEHLI